MDRVKQRGYLHLASAYFMERYGQTPGEGRGAGVAAGPGATLSADGRALRRETICGGELQHDEVEFNLA